MRALHREVFIGNTALRTYPDQLLLPPEVDVLPVLLVYALVLMSISPIFTFAGLLLLQ
jgi:hypothetical protein